VGRKKRERKERRGIKEGGGRREGERGKREEEVGCFKGRGGDLGPC
jgi:hypothetical protein